MEREDRAQVRLSRKDRFEQVQRAKSMSGIAERKRREALDAAREKVDLLELQQPPLQLRLFDSVVEMTVRVLRAVTHDHARGLILIGPPAVGKWSVVHLVSLVTQYVKATTTTFVEGRGSRVEGRGSRV